jgi:hypothetical protein
MGRYPYSARYTVEECRTLEIGFLKDLGYLEEPKVGVIEWSLRGERAAAIGIVVFPRNNPRIIFEYTVGSGKDKQAMEYTFPLLTTPCHFGGKRYWFECGLTKDGQYCGNRVGRLYMAPNSSYFGCRECMDVNYKSQRRNYNSQFGRFVKIFNLMEKRDKLEAKTKRIFYDGRLTKNARKLYELNERLGGMTKSELLNQSLSK